MDLHVKAVEKPIKAPKNEQTLQSSSDYAREVGAPIINCKEEYVFAKGSPAPRKSGLPLYFVDSASLNHAS